MAHIMQVLNTNFQITHFHLPEAYIIQIKSYVYIYICMCVCVCIYIYTHTHTYIYVKGLKYISIHTHIYVKGCGLSRLK